MQSRDATMWWDDLFRMRAIAASQYKDEQEQRQDIEESRQWLAESEKNQITFALIHAQGLDQTGDPDRQWEAACTFYAHPILFKAMRLGMVTTREAATGLVRLGYKDAERELLGVGGTRDITSIATTIGLVFHRAAISIVDPNFEGPWVKEFGWTKNWKFKDDTGAQYDQAWMKIRDTMNYRGKWPHHVTDTIKRQLAKVDDAWTKLNNELKYQPNSGKNRKPSNFEWDYVKWLILYGAVKAEPDIWFSRKLTDRAKRIFESHPSYLYTL